MIDYVSIETCNFTGRFPCVSIVRLLAWRCEPRVMTKHVHLVLHVKWWCHDVELSSNHFLRRVILLLDNFNFINWGSL